MNTVSEIINNLRAKGYTLDFNLNETYCDSRKGGLLKTHPDDFAVDKYYRFEGASDPDDEAVVYAISSDKYQLKGILVNGYGIYSESIADEVMRSLKQRQS